MSSYRNQLTIFRRDYPTKYFYWEENFTTVRNLVDYVIKVYSLEDLDRTRIHLFHQYNEIDLFTKSDYFLSSLGFNHRTFVDVEITSPSTTDIADSSGDVIVQCSFTDQHFNVKVSYLDKFREVEEKIQKYLYLKNRRVKRIDFYDKSYEPIPPKRPSEYLSSVGVKRGDQIYAKIQLESLSISSFSEEKSRSSLTTNVQDEKCVNVVISRLDRPRIDFRIPIHHTVKQLIDEIDKKSPLRSSSSLEIQYETKLIDLKLNSQRLSDLGVTSETYVIARILDKISSSTTTNDSISSSLTSKPVGLSNIGNTCFMNSALQCLVHVKPLTDFFLKSFLLEDSKENSISTDRLNSFDTKSSLTTAYAQLLKTIWLKSPCTIPRLYSSFFTESSHRPYDFKEIIGNLAPRFATYEQQDAQEFMTFFLDRLHQEFRDSTQMDQQSKKIIKHLFYGKLHSIITCLKCQNQYTTTNLFNLLCLPLNAHERIFSIQFVDKHGRTDSTIVPIQNHFQVKHLLRDFLKQSKEYFNEIIVMANDEPLDYETPLKDIPTSELVFVEGDNLSKMSPFETFPYETRKIRLDECFEEFFHDEHLDDPIECEEYCRERTAAKKQFQLDSLPPIVIIQLKRFSHENGYKSKIESFVDYPIKNLDLNRFVRSTSTSTSTSRRNEENGNYVYDLFAVSNHIGSIHFGHYTAFARRGNQWFKFDDSYVSSVFDENDVVTREAYLLFYIRREEENK